MTSMLHRLHGRLNDVLGVDRRHAAPGRRSPRGRRGWAMVVWTSLVCVTTGVDAGFPEVTDRIGRFCGYGWGDGYHACRSSGARPLANLPPRTYSARTGQFVDRWYGCPEGNPCGRPTRLPPTCATQMASTGGDTFYDRFDAFAQQARYEHFLQRVQSPTVAKPLMDPEAHSFPSTGSHGQADSIWNLRHNWGPSVMMSPGAGDGRRNGDAMTPNASLTEEELEDFREYRKFLEQKKRFGKYLIDPDEFEPSQAWGGPPVGTDQRRRMEEARVERLRRSADADASITSPSDHGDPNMPLDAPSFDSAASESDGEGAMPMDQLLPPFPSLESPRSRETDELQWEAPEAIPPGTPQWNPDDADQVQHEAASVPSRQWNVIQQPVRTASQPRRDNFVRQPMR